MAAVPSVGRAAGVERPAGRSADAASDLYERYSAQIFGYCLHQLGSREEAEDAVQTTFMNAFRGLQRGIVPELESAWLFKIAHNVCLSRRRSSWRRGRVEAPNDLEVLQEVVPARERIGDELIRLQDVLEEMPENQRRAILLREWQGLSYREIGEILGLTQAAVETLIFRARRALAAGLEASPSGERQRGWRKRARHAGDAGAVAIGLKALVSGGGAAKIAITALIAAATTIATPIGTHHGSPVRHVVPVHLTAPTHVTTTTRSIPVKRQLAAIARTTHHATPAPTRPRPRPAPTAPVRSVSPPPAPASTPIPTPTTPPTETPAAAASQPSQYHATPTPATEQPGNSDEAPGKAHDNQDSPPPTADPAQPSDEHGKDSAPGQQGKPDHGNGHN